MKSQKHMALGRTGEEAAVEHLRRLGWRIMHRNWRPEGAHAGLEIDIVARTKNELIFVEVKTRTGHEAGAGVEDGIPVYAAFTARKISALGKAAGRYLTAHELWDVPCRFDLICILQLPESSKLEHYKNVIELGHLVGGGDAAWQPW